MLQIAQSQGINSIEKLYDAMRANGLVPEDVRRTMRTEMMKQAVLQQEVDRKIYLGFSSEEVKKYYDANPDKFRKPESVKLSEIYLLMAGKDEAAVKARATELVTQARAGADFGALAAANSEREKNGERTAPKDKGYVGEFDVPNLREDLLAVLKDLKPGGITDPIRTDEGYQILRVDERMPAGSTPTFNDNRLDFVTGDLLHAQLELAIVQQQSVASMDALWEIGIRRRDALRVTLEIADDDGECFAWFQRHGTTATQLTDANLRATQVLEEGDDAPGLFGGAPDLLDDSGVAVVRAVREVETDDVNTGGDQLANNRVAGGCRSQRRDDLRSAHADKVR